MVFHFSCFFLFFIFKGNAKKRNLDENDFRHRYVNFSKVRSGSYLIAAMFKVRSQQLWATLTAVFWKTPNSWRFYGHGSTCVLILSWGITWRENWQRCLENYQSHKNLIPSLANIAPIQKMTFPLFLYAHFSLK